MVLTSKQVMLINDIYEHRAMTSKFVSSLLRLLPLLQTQLETVKLCHRH